MDNSSEDRPPFAANSTSGSLPALEVRGPDGARQLFFERCEEGYLLKVRNRNFETNQDFQVQVEGLGIFDANQAVLQEPQALFSPLRLPIHETQPGELSKGTKGSPDARPKAGSGIAELVEW